MDTFLSLPRSLPFVPSSRGSHNAHRSSCLYHWSRPNPCPSPANHEHRYTSSTMSHGRHVSRCITVPPKEKRGGMSLSRSVIPTSALPPAPPYRNCSAKTCKRNKIPLASAKKQPSMLVASRKLQAAMDTPASVPSSLGTVSGMWTSDCTQAQLLWWACY